jgi:muramoyltetrapeptide carboxypeptidase LdcA involved in peptidoglycan recycling
MEKPLKLDKTLSLIALLCLNGCELNNVDTSSSNTSPYHDKLMNAINEGKISVIAPASWIENEESKTIQEKHPNFWDKIHFQYSGKYEYLSNTDEQRFNFLKQAFDDKISSVVWALRGGYGSARIIPYLFTMKKPSIHKWLIGYSDITSLHLFVSQIWGWKSIHGAVAKEVIYPEKDPKNFKYLEEILSGTSKTITYQGLKLLSGKVTQPSWKAYRGKYGFNKYKYRYSLAN